MTLNLQMPEHEELKPRITVFGVGGAGGNAVNNMIVKQLEGVEFVVANTDAQALQSSVATAKIQMGIKVTEGLGAGARPSVGAAAAEETIEEIVDHLAGSHMCFITAGMGGGTGTGAAPIIAQAARELGVLTVGVVTKPFQFEGAKRMRQAEEGIDTLQRMVDTLIIIPNQNLFRLANEKTTFTEAFSMADDVLYQGVKGVTDLMVKPGLINLDFADVRSVMDEMGKAMMGTGEADGDDRAIEAAERAIANPLLDELSLSGAKGVLINITGGHDLTLFEMDEAANRIRKEVDEDANIIVGSTLDPSMEGLMRVSVVATGIDAEHSRQADTSPRRRTAAEPAGRLEAPAAAEEQPMPVDAAARTEPSAPSFYDAVEQRDADNIEGGERFFTRESSDDLPPPVYVPTPAPAPLAAAEAPQTTFTTARSGRGPSPEAMDRLRAAVGKGERAAPQAAPRAPASESRFGIGSLINRMTGAGGDTPVQRPAAAPAAPKSQAPAEDDERIEIPAFLRRQAN